MPHKQNPQTSSSARPRSSDLEILFEHCFFDAYNTRLYGGGEEPLYLPADQADQPHRLIYREDFFASALHEIAHWCIAGAGRRQLVDFGYWYVPDGRNIEQQSAFERVEVKPQALEWIFSEAAGVGFRVSIDNLSGSVAHTREGCDASLPFRSAVQRQVGEYCERGLPARAERFVQALSEAYGSGEVLDRSRYHLESSTQ